MKFSIKDRLFFIQKIGEEQGMIKSIIRNSLVNKLNLSIEEIEDNNVRETEKGVEWSNPNYTKDIELYKSELDILRPIVESMDENGEIDFSNIDICSQIIG